MSHDLNKIDLNAISIGEENEEPELAWKGAIFERQFDCIRKLGQHFNNHKSIFSGGTMFFGQMIASDLNASI